MGFFSFIPQPNRRLTTRQAIGAVESMFPSRERGDTRGGRRGRHRLNGECCHRKTDAYDLEEEPETDAHGVLPLLGHPKDRPTYQYNYWK
jgi:hypothetical protein